MHIQAAHGRKHEVQLFVTVAAADVGPEAVFGDGAWLRLVGIRCSRSCPENR